VAAFASIQDHGGNSQSGGHDRTANPLIVASGVNDCTDRIGRKIGDAANRAGAAQSHGAGKMAFVADRNGEIGMDFQKTFGLSPVAGGIFHSDNHAVTASLQAFDQRRRKGNGGQSGM
jgi:hypothetical protein